MNDTSRFDHVFEGCSVWIELMDDEVKTDDDDDETSATSSLMQHMEHLVAATGGADKGVYPFVPHVTTLYNFSPPEQEIGASSSTLSGNGKEGGGQASSSLEAYCMERLEACRKEYNDQPKRRVGDNAMDNVIPAELGALSLDLHPESWYSFHYPRSADDGKGFGASIGLLLIRPTDHVSRLCSIVSRNFPSDERGKFTPHISLVYAPEDQKAYVDQYMSRLQEERFLLDTTFRAKFLSVWSTQGRIQDWYRIARVPL